MQLYYEELRHHHNLLGQCVTGQEGNQIIFSCEHGKFLGFCFFYFQWLSTFCMLTTKIISSLFVSCNNYYFKKTFEHGYEVLFVCVLCRIG